MLELGLGLVRVFFFALDLLAVKPKPKGEQAEPQTHNLVHQLD